MLISIIFGCNKFDDISPLVIEDESGEETESSLFNVCYFGNGNDSGEVPVDNVKYKKGDVVVVSDYKTLGKNGNVFWGWSIGESGNAALINSGGVVPVLNNDLKFYAQWSNITYILFDNGTVKITNYLSIGTVYSNYVNVTKPYSLFHGWYYDYSLKKALDYKTLRVYNPVTLYAKWSDYSFRRDPSHCSENTPITSSEIVLKMKKGVGLGLVFETATDAWLTCSFEDLKYMIDAYYQCGMRNMRIPFKWTYPDGVINLSTGEINTNHLKILKVMSLIDYALNKYPDFYIYINSHLDHWGKISWGPSDKRFFENLWLNIAKLFKDYSYRLHFEIVNEPFHGTSFATDYASLREMMRLGFSAIRSTGGKNLYRVIQIAPMGSFGYLLNTTYNSKAKLDEVVNGDYNYTLMHLHVYNPWDYGGYCDYSAGKGEATVLNYLDLYSKFDSYKTWSTTYRIPIVYGEWGVAWRYAKRYADGVVPPNCTAGQLEYIERFTTKMMEQHFASSIWDDGGWYMIFDRTSKKLNEIIGAIF